jgi:Bacterial Ig-like domain (group 3)/Domain of unknown function (DUF4214)
MHTRYLRILAIVALLFALPVAAHQLETPDVAKVAPGPNAQSAAVAGYVDQIVVQNNVTGITTPYPIFIASDGHLFLLNGAGATGLLPGDTIIINGQVDGQSIFPGSIAFVAASAVAAKPAATTQVEGVLRLGHADNFDGTPSEFFYAVVSNDGRHTRVALATLLGVLENGMRVSVSGSLAASGEMTPQQIVVLAPPDTKVKSAAVLKSTPVTTNYLVIPIKFPTNAAAPFTYGADPFTAAALNTAVFGPTTGHTDVKGYYNEVSYGQQLISGVVADNGSGGFLLANVGNQTTCDITVIANAAEAAATARGYNVASYTGILYVFNNVGGCGWSGLAYVGWPRAYSNNTTNLLVIAHEFGHNFGLAHAASLDCGTNIIGGTCSSSEYGDPFDTMGNNRAMHFNSAQKEILDWLPPGSVANHTTGTATYTLAPIELGGGTTYAVKLAAAANRTYWIEYRQPSGYDGGLSGFPNNGAQIRVASPFEQLCSGCFDDTEFLDTTPATSAFTDGTLLVGQSYTDTTYNFTVNVVSATPTLLTLQVVAGAGVATSTTLTAAPNPSVSGGYVLLTATVTGAGASPLGTVAFTDGASIITNCNAVTLSGTGTATCYAYLTVAGSPHAINATYSGSLGYAASNANVSQVVNKAATKTTITAHTPNPVNVGSPIAITTSLTVTSPGSGTPTGVITISDGTANCLITLPATGCSLIPLTSGTKTLTGSYAGDANYTASTSAGVSQTVNAVVTSGTFAIVSGDAQSAHVGSAFATALQVRVLDGSSNPVVGTPVTWSAPIIGARSSFSAITTNTDAQGYAQVTATASAISGAYGVIASNVGRNVTFNLTNTLTSSAGLACALATATVQDLVEQDYQALLQRPSDAGGKAFWISEAARLCPLGIDPKQTFLVLGNVFLNGSEYASLARTDAQFVGDLYVAFLNRIADSGGLTYWTGQLGSGLPRNVVLNSFVFAPEFSATMQSLFGTGTSRSEVSTIVDLYGGLFRRLPDSSGFTYWQTQFRSAQCSGSSAVYARVDDITKQFLGGSEYVGRNRSNSEYVQDLYYAFLRRGGDLPGFNYWVTLLNGGATREYVRQQFLATPEMQGRITQIASETCLP